MILVIVYIGVCLIYYCGGVLVSRCKKNGKCVCYEWGM